MIIIDQERHSPVTARQLASVSTTKTASVAAPTKNEMAAAHQRLPLENEAMAMAPAIIGGMIASRLRVA